MEWELPLGNLTAPGGQGRAFLEMLSNHIILKFPQLQKILQLAGLSGEALVAKLGEISDKKKKPHGAIRPDAELSMFYISALFDGDGNAQLDLGFNSLRLNVTQKWRAILDWLAHKFGGSVSAVYERKEQAAERERRRVEKERRRAAGLPAAEGDDDDDDDDDVVFVDGLNPLEKVINGTWRKLVSYSWDLTESSPLVLCWLALHGVVGKRGQVDALFTFWDGRLEHDMAAVATMLMRGNSAGTTKHGPGAEEGSEGEDDSDEEEGSSEEE